MSEAESHVGISRVKLPTHPNVSCPTTTGLQDHVDQGLKLVLEVYMARPLKKEQSVKIDTRGIQSNIKTGLKKKLSIVYINTNIKYRE